MPTPSRPRPTTSMPVIAPPLKATLSAGPMPLRGCLCGAHIGGDRHIHADEAAGARQHRADDEADRGGAVEKDADQDRQHHADDGDRLVLASQIGSRALLDRACDLLHARVAGVLAEDPAALKEAVKNRGQAAGEGERQAPRSWIIIGRDSFLECLDARLSGTAAAREPARNCADATGWPARRQRGRHGVFQRIAADAAGGRQSAASRGRLKSALFPSVDPP